MNVRRDFYLQQLVDSMWDGQVKVVTGLRRCGKSYLLKNLFGGYLRENGVAEDKIILGLSRGCGRGFFLGDKQARKARENRARD